MRSPMYLKAVLSVFVSFVCAPLPAFASTVLGDDLSNFAVLAATTVTNVPYSAIDGNVGVSTGTSITGFNSVAGASVSDPQVTKGLVESSSPEALLAQKQLATARAFLGLLGPGTLLPSDLAGLTLDPGIYTIPAAATNLSGTLTLDGGGKASALWVFQMPSTLITSPYSTVKLINTGANAGLFWNVGSSATLDSYSTFLGNILALASISANSGATNNCGRLLAQNAAVTLQMNTLSANCSGLFAGGRGLSGGFDIKDAGDTHQVTLLRATDMAAPISNVPLPSSFGLLALGVAGMIAVRRKRFAR